IREYVKRAVWQMSSVSVVGLLKTALLDEENLMTRGSIGQSVGVIIAAIPNHENMLYDIAVDNTQNSKIRVAAMALAHEFMMSEAVIKIAKNLDKFAKTEVAEEAMWMAELALEMYPEIDEDYRDFLNEAGANMINDDSFALLLREANVAYLIDNERSLYRIMFDTKNSYVRFEISRALDKVMRLKQNDDTSMYFS
ncbi:MAG: hypothetical protein M3R61_04540, partial [Chloroflexota bacterium]|nr:hypothetical protein [Chloroflexota bacterium]